MRCVRRPMLSAGRVLPTEGRSPRLGARRYRALASRARASRACRRRSYLRPWRGIRQYGACPAWALYRRAATTDQTHCKRSRARITWRRRPDHAAAGLYEHGTVHQISPHSCTPVSPTPEQSQDGLRLFPPEVGHERTHQARAPSGPRTPAVQLRVCGAHARQAGQEPDRFGLRYIAGALTVGIFDGHSVHDAASGSVTGGGPPPHAPPPPAGAAGPPTKEEEAGAELSAMWCRASTATSSKRSALRGGGGETLLEKKAGSRRRSARSTWSCRRRAARPRRSPIHPNGVMTAWVRLGLGLRLGWTS